MDVKLLALCLLITTSLLYIFYKRYRHIREIGLTGVDLVRAMTVDDGENGGLHGVTRKARSSCVDFKFDPLATFQERPLGRGFEPYPPPIEVAENASSLSSPGDGVGEDDAAKAAARKRRRGIRSWLSCWGRNDRNDQEASPAEASTSTNLRRTGTASSAASAGAPPSIATVAVGEELRAPSPGKNTFFDEIEIEHLEVSTVDATAAGEMAGVGGCREAAAAREASGIEAAATRRSSWARETGVGPRGGQVVRACELNPSCCVCLFDYYLDEEVTLLPCGHLYHTECIDIWMSDHVDCPYCRADINVWATVGGGAAAATGSGPGNCPNRTSAAVAPAPPGEPSPPYRSAASTFPATSAASVAASITPPARTTRGANS
ncbi:unnamed protein product [Ascophyllum nodosum]